MIWFTANSAFGFIVAQNSHRRADHAALDHRLYFPEHAVMTITVKVAEAEPICRSSWPRSKPAMM
ncbi:hypothetical protein MPLB_1870091 [Mesorhizobium sp. ORS 3324]|nr:hypothetical protein MPLB_1870091 [Mesorhizobium sp. ORS 3324]